MATKTVTRERRAAKPSVMPQGSQRIRRVRIAGRIAVQPGKIRPEDQKRMETLLKSISEHDKEIERRVELRKEDCAALHLLMKTYRIPVFTSAAVPDYKAEVYKPKGRTTNVIDPVGFRELVTDDDFMACVKISMEKAKEVLSGKELASVTDSTPGVDGEEIIKVESKK